MVGVEILNNAIKIQFWNPVYFDQFALFISKDFRYLLLFFE